MTLDAEQRVEVRCWRYEPANGRTIAPRLEPDVNGAKQKKLIHPGSAFRVCRELQGADGVLYLQLADSGGWLFDRKPGVGAMCFRAEEEEPEEESDMEVEVLVERPSRPPGAHWTQYKCVALGAGYFWWYYEGPLGKWWCEDADKEVEPYVEDDSDEREIGEVGNVDLPRKKLRCDKVAAESSSAPSAADTTRGAAGVDTRAAQGCGDGIPSTCARPSDGLTRLMASESLRCDRQAVLDAVKSNGLAIAYAEEKLRQDREVALAAVAQDGSALQFLPAELQADREVVITAVRQHGSVLQFAAEELRNDAEVVLLAVSNYGKALQVASSQLRGDREIVLTAVQQCGWALRFAALELRRDQHVVSTAIRQKASAFSHRRRSRTS